MPTLTPASHIFSLAEGTAATFSILNSISNVMPLSTTRDVQGLDVDIVARTVENVAYVTLAAPT